MSIQVKNLTKIYDQQKAINNICFEANKGQILGFLGPNGAGKTTTMKIISCFMPASSGTVTVCGFDVSKNPLEVKKRIGYLAEHNPLYDNMYVKESLKFVAGIHGIENAEERIAEMIKLTGLEKEKHKLLRSLSKGFRQRVGLAQAMIHDPEVLILDEPTSGLDPNQLVEIRQLIKNIAKNKTVIFSSHIMQEIQHLCDRVIILNKGILVADDDIETLKNRVRGGNLLKIEFFNNIDEKILSEIDGIIEIRKLSEKSFELLCEINKDIRVDVFEMAVTYGWKIIEMHQEEISIESVFQTLTN